MTRPPKEPRMSTLALENSLRHIPDRLDTPLGRLR